MGQLDGHCLCGKVTYTCDADPMMTAVCHCKDCQRGSGGAFSVNVVVGRDTFHMEGESLAHYETLGEENGLARQRYFCSNCGSPIATFLTEMPDMAVIKAGTLDDASFLVPDAELWTRSAQPWAPQDAERGLFPMGLPSS
jgi:hypothetical protein